MSECPGTDTLLTIGAALEWDVPRRLQHLQDCDACRLELEALRLTRAAFSEIEEIDPAIGRSLSATVRDAARRETSAAPRSRDWTRVVEPVLAGGAAVIVLATSGIRVENVTAALLAFALGATSMLVGKALARSVPSLRVAHADD